MKRTTGSTDSTMVEVKTRGGVQKMGEIDDLGGYLTSRLTLIVPALFSVGGVSDEKKGQ